MFPVTLTGFDVLSLAVLLVLALLVRLGRREEAIASRPSADFDEAAGLERADLGSGPMVATLSLLTEAGPPDGLVADLPALLAEVSPAAERRSTDPAALAVFPWLAAYAEEAQPAAVAPAVLVAARLVLVVLMLMALLYRLAQG